jgi:hypothetical protein
MNDQKPNTQAQREVDKLVQQEMDNRAQTECDAAVSEMEKGQSKSDAKGQNAPVNLKQDASPKSAPAPETKTQEEDNGYYNGMSQ